MTWISVAGMAAGIIVILCLFWTRRRRSAPRLPGSVSQRWLSEHRASRPGSQR